MSAPFSTKDKFRFAFMLGERFPGVAWNIISHLLRDTPAYNYIYDGSDENNCKMICIETGTIEEEFRGRSLE